MPKQTLMFTHNDQEIHVQKQNIALATHLLQDNFETRLAKNKYCSLNMTCNENNVCRIILRQNVDNNANDNEEYNENYNGNDIQDNIQFPFSNILCHAFIDGNGIHMHNVADANEQFMQLLASQMVASYRLIVKSASELQQGCASLTRTPEDKMRCMVAPMNDTFLKTNGGVLSMCYNLLGKYMCKKQDSGFTNFKKIAHMIQLGTLYCIGAPVSNLCVIFNVNQLNTCAAVEDLRIGLNRLQVENEISVVSKCNGIPLRHNVYVKICKKDSDVGQLVQRYSTSLNCTIMSDIIVLFGVKDNNIAMVYASNDQVDESQIQQITKKFFFE